MLACGKLLDEHEEEGSSCTEPEHRMALANRAKGAPGWSPIVHRRKETVRTEFDEVVDGWRDFLDGVPIHCGSALELQGVEYKFDDFGEYALYAATGVIVRYELAWGLTWGGKDGSKVVLHASVAGYEFTAEHEPWMRFRWPRVAASADRHAGQL